MDILHLVDRLEELINSARNLPLTHTIIVDEDRILELIDQMRVSIPEEVKKSKKVMAEADRIKADAKEEAERTLATARDQKETMIDRDSLTAATQSRADEILQQAHLNAEVVEREADDYVFDSLSELETHLNKLLTQVRNGLNRIKAERAEGDKPR